MIAWKKHRDGTQTAHAHGMKLSVWPRAPSGYYYWCADRPGRTHMGAKRTVIGARNAAVKAAKDDERSRREVPG